MDEEAALVEQRIHQEVMDRWHADGAEVSIKRLCARLAKWELSADLAVRGFRRWKRNSQRRGDRHEAEHGMTDLGQGIYELAELLHQNEPSS